MGYFPSFKMTHQRQSRDQSSTVSSEKTAPVQHQQQDERGPFTTPSDEKIAGGVDHHDPTKAQHDSDWDANTEIDFSHIDEKKVLRKMDIRLVPMLALLYLLSFLDRGNIGNAKIEGLTDDLGLSAPQYNWCLTVFFFTYCAFEVPSNLMYVFFILSPYPCM